MSSIPRVLAVGSCRIFRPLRRLHKAGRLELVNYLDNFWFTHTAAAARQYVEVMQGDKAIPTYLRDASLETPIDFPEDMAAGLPDVDVVAVEVSSLKQHRIGEYHLNAHKVHRIASASGLPYRPIVNGDTGALPGDHVLKPLVVDYTTRQELRGDLVTIRDLVGAPILTVDHLYTLRPDGTPPPERVKLTEELHSIGLDYGVPFYSTKELILEHGIDVALLDQNHYRPEFEILAGEGLYPKLISLAGGVR